MWFIAPRKCNVQSAFLSHFSLQKCDLQMRQDYLGSILWKQQKPVLPLVTSVWNFSISVTVPSGSWWWTGRPGVLRFTGLQRVGHDRATELNWTIPYFTSYQSKDKKNKVPPIQGEITDKKLVFYILMKITH